VRIRRCDVDQSCCARNEEVVQLRRPHDKLKAWNYSALHRTRGAAEMVTETAMMIVRAHDWRKWRSATPAHTTQRRHAQPPTHTFQHDQQLSPTRLSTIYDDSGARFVVSDVAQSGLTWSHNVSTASSSSLSLMSTSVIGTFNISAWMAVFAAEP
jgi:hypothetical protein